MRNMAYVVTIKEKQPIEGKDLIVVYSFEENGYNVIGAKDDFSVGDKGVYFEVDSLLPQRPEFEFLRKRCYNVKTDRFLIKNMKMSGIYSNGLLMTFEQCKIKHYKPGKDLTKKLDIGKYEPEDDASPQKENSLFKLLMRVSWLRPILKKLFLKKKGGQPRYFPSEYISKSDEVNIQNNKYLWKPEEEVYISLKIEGQSHLVMLNPKTKQFETYGRNTVASVDQQNFDNEAMIKLKLEKALTVTGCCFALQGEYINDGVNGAAVQKGIYKNGKHFYVYKVKDLTNNKVLSFSEMKVFVEQYDFEMVPVIFEGTLRKFAETIVDAQEATEHFWYKVGEDKIRLVDDRLEKNINAKNGYHRHEGIVVRSLDQKISFKIKSNEYALAGL